MNDRQKAFCEYYAENPNATDAARRAGYSEKTAYSIGQENLKKPELLAYIRRLQAEAAEIRIASVQEAKAVWSDIMRDPDQRAADRIRAGELIAKAAGAFLHFRPDPNDPGLYAVGEASDEDVVIYLPAVGDLAECETDEDDDPDALQTMEVNTPHEPTIAPR